jgi:hypothetical protein
MGLFLPLSKHKGKSDFTIASFFVAIREHGSMTVLLPCGGREAGREKSGGLAQAAGSFQ